MRFARGPNGFKVTLSDAVDEFQRVTLADHPELQRFWDAALERLRFAGHHMGTPVDGNDSNRYAEIETSAGDPIIYVAWRIKGDEVYVLNVMF